MKKILVILTLALLLGGCADQMHYRKVERGALHYYRNKYQLKDVEISGSYKAGNSGLFGFAGVKDRAYEMSDGFHVYWDDDEETYADDRQADQIKEDFDRVIYEPLMATLSAPHLESGHRINATDYESFDRSVFTGYYDGDIMSFLKNEKPALSDLTIFIEEKAGFDHEAWTDRLYERLDPYLSGFLQVGIVSDLSLVSDPERCYMRIGDPGHLAEGTLRFGEGIRWKRQHYIDIGQGVMITSAESDIVFDEGDIRLAEAGKAQELQAILDASYEEMPVAAEENKDGSYVVHDQQHEKRVILKDPNVPYYRLEISQKIRDLLYEDRISVYLLYEGEVPLYVRYGYGNAGYILFKVGSQNGTADFHDIHPDNLYYFGEKMDQDHN